MYEPGEYIHCGSSGLCKVEDITTLDFSEAGRDRLYYRLAPVEESSGTLYIPVDNDKVPMRRVLTKEEAAELIRDIPGIGMLEVPDEKKRENCYREALSSMDCHVWVMMIKTLAQRMKARSDEGKKLLATEERYYHAVKKRLDCELAVAMDLTSEELDQYVADFTA